MNWLKINAALSLTILLLILADVALRCWGNAMFLRLYDETERLRKKIEAPEFSDTGTTLPNPPEHL